MKKGLFAISFVFYFIATSGLVVNYHYCMKKLASVNLFQTSTDVCERCGMDSHESNGCCHDEVKVVKLEQDQNKIPVTLYNFSIAAPEAVIPSVFLIAAFENAGIQKHFLNHSPPLLSAQDTYLQNNVFRI
jgi:hypothetical protein